jgi:hypothetical protein
MNAFAGGVRQAALNQGPRASAIGRNRTSVGQIIPAWAAQRHTQFGGRVTARTS